MKNGIIIVIAGLVICIIGMTIVFVSSKSSKKCSVTFINEDYEFTMYVKKGDKIEEPKVPIKEGYDFVKWYTGDELFDFTKAINGDIILVSKYEKKQEELPVKPNPETEKQEEDVLEQTPDTNNSSNEDSIKPNTNNNNQTVVKPNTNNNNNQTVKPNTNGGNNTTENKPTTIPVTSVTLNKTNYSMEVNDSITLSAIINPSNATNKNIVWSSSNNSVATVSNGFVKAVGSGTVTITATVDGKKASCVITVTAPVTYSYEIVDVPGSVTGQCYIYIKSSTGSRVSGSLTITYTNGGSETVDVSSSGYMVPSRSAIASVSSVKGS